MKTGEATLVSSVLLLGIASAARELGVSVIPALQKFGIDPALLDNSHGLLPLTALVEFLEYSAREFKCPHFALLINKHRPALSFGVLTHLLNASPNVETALVMGNRHAKLLNPARTWLLETGLHSAVVKRIDHSGYSDEMTQMLALTIGQYFKLLQGLMGPSWRATSISFIFPSPTDPKPYKQFFGTRIYFNQVFNSIQFPINDLRTPIHTHDPDLLVIIEQYLTGLESPQGDSLSSKVERVIGLAVGNNICTLQFAADSLGIHYKALQRELKAEGTTFRELLHGARMRYAKYYLANSAVDLENLANILGFSGASALSRTFKLESGLSPKHWRQQQTKLGWKL
jgi:AraC-like DNA-binding protein